MKPWFEQLKKNWGVQNGRLRNSYVVEKGRGRRLIIPDIHGCSRTFEALLNKLAPTKEDQLFLLGDMVNRGPGSHLVLDTVKELLNEGYQVYPLRGNHEQILLTADRKSQRNLLYFAQRQNSTDLLNSKGYLKRSYKKLMDSLPYYYHLDIAYLVHAGINFRNPQPFQAFNDMLWIRDFPVPKLLPGDRFIVHGHNPRPLGFIEKKIRENAQILPLDNAIIPGLRGPGYGNLLCLDLDTRELIQQPNLDVYS